MDLHDQSADPGVMLRLKHATDPQHRATERHALQRELATGILPRQRYVAWLEQLHLVHRELEWHLTRLRWMRSPLADVIRDDHFQVAALERDLAFFDVDPATIVPTPATAALVGHIDTTARRARLGLLGFHYVLEGSKNGGRHIAKRARLAYRLPGDSGVAYLDPYGAAQGEHWQQFKDAMETHRFAAGEVTVMVGAARSMFEQLAAMMDDVLVATANDGTSYSASARS